MKIQSNHIVALTVSDETINFHQMLKHIHAIKEKLIIEAFENDKILVTCDCAYKFLVAVLASFVAKKTVIILPNSLEETLKQYKLNYEFIINDDFVNTQNDNSIFDIGDGIHIPDNAKIHFYTSGSSGIPSKIAKKFISLWAEVNDTVDLCETSSYSLVASTVPHHHLYGFLFKILAPLIAKVPFYIPIIRFPSQIGNFHNFMLVSSPAFLSRLDQDDSIKGCKKIISSGGPLSIDAGNRVSSIFDAPGIEVYGSTETGGIGYRFFADAKLFSPLPGVDIRTNSENHLEIQSSYLGSMGWYTCSDFVSINVDGKFEILGRSDDVIKIEEKRISLIEIQNLLTSNFEFIEKSYIFPFEKNNRKKLAALLVKKKNHIDLDEKKVTEEIISFLKKKIDPIFIPKKLKFVNFFETNEMGKAPRAKMIEEVLGSV